MPKQKPKKRIWLSVDWDYFCRQPKEWWYGGIDEKMGLDPMMWMVKATLAQTRGTDLKSEMSLRHASPTPGAFWRALERLGMRFDDVKDVQVSESHKDAYGLFQGKDTEGVEMVNFDAHHDLLYASKFMVEAIEKSKPDCGNWHLLTLLRYPKLRSVTVYPHWKGLSEWKRTLSNLRSAPSGVEVISYLHRRTRANVWPHVKLPTGQVEKIFICRSGAWSPPWHDRAFLNFVEGCENTIDRLFLDWGVLDELAPRSFSWTKVNKMAAIEANILLKRCIDS